MDDIRLSIFRAGLGWILATPLIQVEGSDTGRNDQTQRLVRRKQDRSL
jgi:hypothetical protein